MIGEQNDGVYFKRPVALIMSKGIAEECLIGRKTESPSSLMGDHREEECFAGNARAKKVRLSRCVTSREGMEDPALRHLHYLNGLSSRVSSSDPASRLNCNRSGSGGSGLNTG